MKLVNYWSRKEKQVVTWKPIGYSSSYSYNKCGIGNLNQWDSLITTGRT
jgi:hypothetical protein